MSISPSRLEPRRKYAERQGVSTKTVDRWERAGILRPSQVINGRHYHDPDDKPRRDDPSRLPRS
jgi:predicted site-specific integrase-resolvase